MTGFTLSQARVLCTAKELQLFRSSRRPAIGKLNEAALKRNVAQARKLRDKWRGLLVDQRRAAARKQEPRAGGRNARTREKGELFSEVLARFEARLAALTASSAPPVSPAKGRKPRAASGVGGEKARVKAGRQKSGRSASAQRRAAAWTEASAAPPPQSRQLAEAAAKRAQIRVTGLTSRVRGHVSARGRRAQGRRDNRR